MKKTIKLTKKQLEILGQIAQEKQLLQQEFAKVVKRESDVIVALAEANNFEIQPNDQISVVEGELVITRSEAEPRLRKAKKANNEPTQV